MRVPERMVLVMKSAVSFVMASATWRCSSGLGLEMRVAKPSRLGGLLGQRRFADHRPERDVPFRKPVAQFDQIVYFEGLRAHVNGEPGALKKRRTFIYLREQRGLLLLPRRLRKRRKKPVAYSLDLND
ncbi:MAG: hypothetical protein HND47_15130 [Chloroflexi bacterium]|nr:hypothetical protein [Chloroflexota bacterium]